MNHTPAPVLHQQYLELKFTIIPRFMHYMIKPCLQEGTVLILFQSTLSPFNLEMKSLPAALLQSHTCTSLPESSERHKLQVQGRAAVLKGSNPASSKTVPRGEAFPQLFTARQHPPPPKDPPSSGV